MRHLIAYDWPGNVRELENAIERPLRWAPANCPCSGLAEQPAISDHERLPERNELVPLDELERRAILRTLRETAATSSKPRASWASANNALSKVETIQFGRGNQRPTS